MTVSNLIEVFYALEDPIELWDTFKHETLETVRDCVGGRSRSQGGFALVETLDTIEKSRAARLAGSRDRYRALSRRIRTLLSRDNERYIRSLAEDVEGHLNANDLKPAYRALKKLRFMSTSQVSVIQTADSCLVSDTDGQMARWAEYLEQLFKVNPPSGWLQTTGLQVMDADLPINEAAPSIVEFEESLTKLRGGKAVICNINAELFKSGDESMIHGLHAVLTAVWH